MTRTLFERSLHDRARAGVSEAVQEATRTMKITAKRCSQSRAVTSHCKVYTNCICLGLKVDVAISGVLRCGPSHLGISKFALLKIEETRAYNGSIYCYGMIRSNVDNDGVGVEHTCFDIYTMRHQWQPRLCCRAPWPESARDRDLVACLRHTVFMQSWSRVRLSPPHSSRCSCGPQEVPHMTHLMINACTCDAAASLARASPGRVIARNGGQAVHARVFPACGSL